MRTAVVTGASRGLGAAIAASLAGAGHRVAVNYFASPQKAEALCAQLVKQGSVAKPYRADIRDEAEVRQMIAAVEKDLGPIEVVVANATGHQPTLSIEEQTWQSYLDQMEFFVKSPLLLMRAVLPQWKERRFGRFLQIGSEVVELGNPSYANYVAAKGAQLGQTRSWARELAPWGVTVNLIAPGWIPTERSADATEAAKQAYIAGVPLGHMGVPEDVGAMAAFLASDEAGFLTGQKFAVNGGNTLL